VLLESCAPRSSFSFGNQKSDSAHCSVFQAFSSATPSERGRTSGGEGYALSKFITDPSSLAKKNTSGRLCSSEAKTAKSGRKAGPSPGPKRPALQCMFVDLIPGSEGGVKKEGKVIRRKYNP